MEAYELLSSFFEAIKEDPRISITYIGIYTALLQYWQSHAQRNPFKVYSYEVMPLAKISAPTTYLKIIRQLHEYGYIRYTPSYKKGIGSQIYLVDPP